MELPLFWIHKHTLDSLEGDYGFSLFSIGHLLWLLGIALCAVAMSIIYRRLDQARRDTLRKCMAIGVILLELSKIYVMGLTRVDMSDYLPLELCSLAGFFVIIDAIWPNKRFIHQLLMFIFNAGALAALICSSATSYPFWNFYSIHIFAFHGYLVVYSVMRIAAGEYKPFYWGTWASLGVTVLMGIPIYFIDSIFNVNYMFLGGPYDIAFLISIWNAFAPIGGRFLYALGIGAVAIAAVHLLYFVYKLPTIVRFIKRKIKKVNC